MADGTKLVGVVRAAGCGILNAELIRQGLLSEHWHLELVFGTTALTVGAANHCEYSE